jgi:hypothetical protein
MLVLLKTQQFLLSNISLLEKKVNMIMDGYFTKLIYSDDCMTMNGIFFELPITITNTSSIQSKYIAYFDTVVNRDWIYKLSVIEKQILQYYMFFFGITNKTPNYSLKQQIQNGSIKYYKDHMTKGNLYYIKLSGIWETHNEIGITYKMIEC